MVFPQNKHHEEVVVTLPRSRWDYQILDVKASEDPTGRLNRLARNWWELSHVVPFQADDGRPMIRHYLRRLDTDE